MTENKAYTFGEYVKKLRADKGWSLSHAAKRMGLPAQKLCDIEAGRRYHTRISIDLVQKVSIAFEVSISEVIKSIKSTMSVKRSTEDVLAELLPESKMVEMLADKMVEACSTFPKELEDMAVELRDHVQNIRILVALIQNRKVVLQKEE